jgi:hypothetical protein
MMADERAAEVRTIKAAPSGVLGEKKCGARAEPPLRLGPVGPNDIIFATVGSNGVFAFYEPDGTHCVLHVVVYSRADESGASAAGIRVSMNADQIVSIDSPDNETLKLKCGDHAETLSVVEPSTFIAAEAAQ